MSGHLFQAVSFETAKPSEAYRSLGQKSTLQLRLLAEEMLGLLRQLAGEIYSAR